MPAEIRILTAIPSCSWQVERTRRSLPQSLPNGRWLLQAGCWLPRKVSEFIPAMPDHPYLLLGSTITADKGLPTPAWLQVLQKNGGLFQRSDLSLIPTVQSLWISAAAAALSDAGEDMQTVIADALQRGWPVIRHSPLDVCHDTRPRVLQVLTSLQRGGAERLALDLHHALSQHGVAGCLMTLGSPTRDPFEAPEDALQHRLPPEPAKRAAEIDQAACRYGIDLLHAHLVDGQTLSLLRSGVPLMHTFHNQRAGWPASMECLNPMTEALLIGCAQTVSKEIAMAYPQHVVRTVWNGIQPHSPRTRTGRDSAPSLTIVAIANPRQQKRLPLLIDVLSHLPGARLKIAGQVSRIHAEAWAEVEHCQEKITAYGLNHAVEWLGAVSDIPALLAEADVLVSTSLHEGMSLAQLEALAAGLPVVATEVSGTEELSARHPGRMKLLPVDAEPASFAAAITEVMAYDKGGALAADFTTPVMAGRYAWLMHAKLISRTQARSGLVLISNNFSTGGAQSSARRLLLGMRDLGKSVRAVVLQEQLGNPTLGTLALRAAGIPVLMLEPPEVREAQAALLPLLQSFAQEPPEAVLFWNVIPEYKLLLADALWGFPVFDVSPGEMYFTSLKHYFTHPRPGLPMADARTYGLHLRAVIVKHASELPEAQTTLGCPVHLIPNGILCRNASEEADGVAPVIGSASRIHPHKRLEDLIHAFRLVHAKHPQSRLRIAGSADAGQQDYAESLRQSAHDLPVEWCGEITDMAAFHDTLCLFVMISEPSGCPNASLEAMASSLPIVATAVGGAREQIEHGISGLLTPPRDPEAMSRAIMDLLTQPRRRAQMRAASLARAQTYFSLEKMISSYLRVTQAEKV
jgi:glycosyltransferase involved in cell wall biosynthesis